MNTEDSVQATESPRLSRRMRLQYEPAQTRWVLLYPEGKVQLNDSGAPVKVALHTSCSARREMNTHLHGRELLAQLRNVERVDHSHESECCGFGGTFSVRMPDISGAMVADKTRALQDSGAHQVLSADCGCLMNINGALEKQQAALRGQHLASFLWQRTGGER